MKCPACGYNIPDGMHKCLCCGYAVTALRMLSEEEIKRNREKQQDDTTGYKTIDPDSIHMGQEKPQGRPFSFGGGSLFDSFFGDSPFDRQFGGGVFGSIGSIIGEMFGGMFGGGTADEDYYEDGDADGEEGFTYDALGYRIPKPPAKTMVVTEVEEFDENGELKPKKGKKNKDKRKDGK